VSLPLPPHGLHGPYCPVCGQRRPGAAVTCPNVWCRRSGRAFSVAFSVGVYAGALRRAIGRYKYGGERGLGPAFAGMVAAHITAHPEWFEEFSVITAVPAYTGPGARREWDPVGAILAELPDRLGSGWAVEPGLVAKTAETPGMAGLGWSGRQAVAQGPLRRALRPGRPARLGGVQVLLLDDVLTEGSTLREVAGVLRRQGASDVAALVLARPLWVP
jgi:predicted amidophosphoribosyltransferase